MTDEEIEKQAEGYLKQDGTNGEKVLDEIFKKYPIPIKVKDEEEKENLVKLLCDYSKEVWKDGAKWGMEQICKICEERTHKLGKSCAFRSLGNDYCWE